MSLFGFVNVFRSLITNSKKVDEHLLREQLFKILGCQPSASVEQLRSAHQQHLKKWTDRKALAGQNNEMADAAEKKLAEVYEAYDCLSNPIAFQKYLDKMEARHTVLSDAVHKAAKEKLTADRDVSEALE